MNLRPGLALAASLTLAAAVPALAAQGAAPPASEKPSAKPAGKPPGKTAGRREAAFPYPIHQAKLANGLRIVVVPFDSPGIVGYYSVVRTGSRDEVEAGHSGFAHFFEHMMSRGTDRYSKDQYSELLERMGADSNAFTTDDFTNYYIIGPSARLPTMMDMESDRFKNLKYAEDAFRTESQAVLGEYNKGASSPFQPMEEKLRDLAFSAHTYKHTTIGFLADVQAMPGYYDYSRGFFARFYRPENVVLVVAGDVSPEKVFALAKRYYGDWKPGYQAPAIAPEPAQTAAREAHLDWPNPGRPQMVLAYHTPAFSTATPDSAALDLIAQLLFAESSPLYQDIVVKRQWADSLMGDADPHRDPYLFTVEARVRSADLLPQVQQAVEAALADLGSHPVDTARLARVKSHLRYRLALSLDSPAAVARALASAIELTGDPQALNRLFEQYDRVTPQDISRVARQVFRRDNETLVTLAHRAATAPAAGGK